MSEIKNILIKNYRGIKNLTINDLNKINIFVGPNNSGKTSILEAIGLSIPLIEENLSTFIDSLGTRYHRFTPDTFISMFPIDNEDNNAITIMSEFYNNLKINLSVKYEKDMNIDENGESFRNLKCNYNYNIKENGKVSEQLVTVILSEERKGLAIRHRVDKNSELKIIYNYVSFSRMDRNEKLLDYIDKLLENNQRKELIGALKIFDESIENFEVVGKSRIVKIFSTKHKKPLTIYDYGNGTYKVFFIITAALLSKNGILLIDEVEAGIHIKALAKVVDKLLKICELNNVQLFMTTHSLETVDSILYNYDENDSLGNNIVTYHLKKNDESSKAIRYSANKLKELRENLGFDIR